VRIDDPELDPRIAAAYDGENAWGADLEHFLGIVTARPGARVVDLGCGTGTLTTAIALAGHDVTGVDPNPAFLAIAAAKRGGELVRWLRGTSADLTDDCAEVALMTSHVAQVFLHDDEWARVLSDLRRALVTGGVLAFDTRDPAARAWESWPADMRIELPGGGVAVLEHTKTFVDGVASFEGTVVVSQDGSAGPGATWSRTRWGYRFRSAEVVRSSLEAAGFRVDDLDVDAGEILALATAV
jgi:SAM-dependent methyltransferase